jgi:hypothetical protein
MCHRDQFALESGVYLEDYNLVFYWYKNELPITSSEKVTHFWREHPKRTSRNSKKNYDQEAFFSIETGAIYSVGL